MDSALIAAALHSAAPESSLLHTHGTKPQPTFGTVRMPPSPSHTADLRGRKLSDARAHDVAERLQLIVDDACKAPGGGEFTEASVGPSIRLSNVSHPSCTEVGAPGALQGAAGAGWAGQRVYRGERQPQHPGVERQPPKLHRGGFTMCAAGMLLGRQGAGPGQLQAQEAAARCGVTILVCAWPMPCCSSHFNNSAPSISISCRRS